MAAIRYLTKDVDRSIAFYTEHRLVVEVVDLPARVAAMKQKGLSFRNEIESGPAGKQIQLDDPDGNPIELFQAA